MIESSSFPYAFKAIRNTVLKASPDRSANLPDTDRWPMPAGSILRAKAAQRHQRHIRLEDVARGEGLPASETLRFVYEPHWEVIGAPLPPASQPERPAARPKPGPRVVVDWLPPLTETSEHYLHYVPGGETLVVTFDHLGARGSVMSPWAGKFVTDNGWSLLGVTSRTSSWFRAPDLHSALEGLAARGLFRMFRRVVLAGPSMGGFGAGAFSSLAPGCTVVLTSPQSTLRPDLVPWERRYPEGRRQDWSGRFTDAAAEVQGAAQVIIAYDPMVEPDRLHAERFPAHNRMLLPAPHMGHTLVAAFQEMKVLKPFMLACIEGRMELAVFRTLMRRRRLARAYHESLMEQASRLGRHALLASLGESRAAPTGLSTPRADPPRSAAGNPRSAG